MFNFAWKKWSTRSRSRHDIQVCSCLTDVMAGRVSQEGWLSALAGTVKDTTGLWRVTGNLSS